MFLIDRLSWSTSTTLLANRLSGANTDPEAPPRSTDLGELNYFRWKRDIGDSLFFTKVHIKLGFPESHCLQDMCVLLGVWSRLIPRLAMVQPNMSLFQYFQALSVCSVLRMSLCFMATAWSLWNWPGTELQAKPCAIIYALLPFWSCSLLSHLTFAEEWKRQSLCWLAKENPGGRGPSSLPGSGFHCGRAGTGF